MYLITGASGQLGHELTSRLSVGECIAASHEMLDITDVNAVKEFANKYSVDTIINCAAYTAVDLAESDKQNAYALNALGPKYLAQLGRPMIHISTDYVFDGTVLRPLRPDDATNPKSVYGETKLAGERAVMEYASTAVIIRTSWLYSPYGKNFMKTMQKLGASKKEINVVSDQIGTPTYAGDLANAIIKILPQIKKNTHEIYHYSNAGKCSWYDFACEIMMVCGLDCRVNPINTSGYPTPAARPAYSVLDKSKIIRDFGVAVPNWRDGLYRCVVAQRQK